MSHRGGGGKRVVKEAVTFENFSSPLILLGYDLSELKSNFELCKGDTEKIKDLQSRLAEDSSFEEWQVKSTTKKSKDKPAPVAATKNGGSIENKSNNSNSAHGARLPGFGGYKPIGGFNKNRGLDIRQKPEVNLGVAGQTAPENNANLNVEKKAAAPAPAPTPPSVPATVVTVPVAIGVESYASRAKRKDTEAARKREEENRAAEDALAEKKQQEIDAANAAAKKKKDARPSKPKNVKSDAKPEASSIETAAVAVSTTTTSEVETVPAPAPQPETSPAAKKEAKFEATTTTQIEQSFTNLTTSDTVLSTSATEPPAAIANIQVQAQVQNISASTQINDIHMSTELYKPTVQAHSSNPQLVFGDGHVSSNSQQAQSWNGTWGVDAAKPPGLGHKEPSHVQQQNQRHSGAKAPSMSDTYPPHIQQQQQQQQPTPTQYYSNSYPYNSQMGMQMGMPPNVNFMPNYPANAPYTPAQGPAPSPLVPNSMTGVSPPSAPIANNQPVIGNFGQQGQGQLQGQQGQGQLPQQQQQWPPQQWMPFPGPNAYSPYYNHFMPYPNYPRFAPARGGQGTYEQQYPNDYPQNYGYGDTSNVSTMQPSQPSNKQGKANNSGGQVNSNAQAQADHIGSQYAYPRAYDPSYQQQWAQQPMYQQPAPNNQPPGMAGRPIDGNNRPAISNQHQNFPYPNNSGRNNPNPQYNVGGLGGYNN